MCVTHSMLSLLTPKHSDQVGGPIGSMREAKKVESYPNYDAAYLAKRLGARNPTVLERNRYNAPAANFANQTDELVYLQNATKGYEAEAEECLKKEFKDWLTGRHMDNVFPQAYDNSRGGAIRRDMHGQQLDGWKPTWWGPHQLTYLPGVREYLREQAERADKNSLDMNVLAHLGPQNLEEAWAYFKHWVKARPVGPEECLNKSPIHPTNVNLPFRAGPTHMQHDTQYHPDQPYGGGGGGAWFGGGGGGTLPSLGAPAMGAPAIRGGAATLEGPQQLLLEGPVNRSGDAWRSMAEGLFEREQYRPSGPQQLLLKGPVNRSGDDTWRSMAEGLYEREQYRPSFWADRDMQFESEALRAPPPTPAEPTPAEPIEQVLDRYGSDDDSIEAMTANSEAFELDEAEFDRIQSRITDDYLGEVPVESPSEVLSVPSLFDLPGGSSPQAPYSAGGTAVGAYSPFELAASPPIELPTPLTASSSSDRPAFGRVALRRRGAFQSPPRSMPSAQTEVGRNRARRYDFITPMSRMFSLGRSGGS